MNESVSTKPPEVREITIGCRDAELSGLLSEPPHHPPRGVVVALHGGGMRAGYFHARAELGLSMLTLGAELGYAVLSLDRPGYGLSAVRFPAGQGLFEQVDRLHAALDEYAEHRPVGDGFLLVGHSYGGKLAMSAAAADGRRRLLGLDVSGCGYRYAADVERGVPPPSSGAWRLHWGPSRLYPPDTFRRARSLLAPMPERELRDVAEWPDHFPGVAERLRVPVRFTFAEHELWWRHDPAATSELRESLPDARVTVEHQPDAGHNISMGWAARAYHLRVFAFADDCVRRWDPSVSTGATTPRAGERDSRTRSGEDTCPGLRPADSPGTGKA